MNRDRFGKERRRRGVRVGLRGRGMQSPGQDHSLDMSEPRIQAVFEKLERLAVENSDAQDALLDVAYGHAPRQCYDVFPAGANSPAIVFIHGGYWRGGTKENWRFPARTWRSLGLAWISIEYRLCPEVALECVVEDVQAALAHIDRKSNGFGIDTEKLHVVGHSAGAHLAAMAVQGIHDNRCNAASLTLISGLYDLEPLLFEDAQSWLRLDRKRAAALSPIGHTMPKDLPVLIVSGADETPAFRQQSQEYEKACQRRGANVRAIDLPGRNHFECALDIGDIDSPLVGHLKSHVGLV